MRKLISLVLGFFFLFGCASSTVIKSNPPGAKLYLEGKLKGETPYTHVDRATAGAMKTVTLKKEGYKDFTGHIKKEELSVSNLVIGILLWYPLLIWVKDYPPQYTFEMDRLSADLPAKPQAARTEKPTRSIPVTPSQDAAKIVTVIWTFANIRSGVGNEFPVVTTAKQGDKLTVVGEYGEWFNVRLEDGKEGWISNRVVK